MGACRQRWAILILCCGFGFAVAVAGGAFGCGAGTDVDPIDPVDPSISISNIAPADGATGVPVNVVVEVTFDAPVDPADITSETFRLAAGGGGAEVVGTIAFDSALNKASFTPAAPLEFAQCYRATIGHRSANTAGVNMASDYTWSFETEQGALSLSLDAGFGDQGLALIDPGRAFAFAGNILSQPDGKVLISGYNSAAILGGNASLAVVRLNADGSLDPAFGAGGIATVVCVSKLGLNWWSKQGLALQSDGRILLGGECDKVATVFRLNSDGTPDAGFGVGGKAVLPTDPGQVHSTVLVLKTQESGGEEKVLVGGQLEPASWRAKWLLARLDADGSLDATFASGAGILFQQWRHYDEGIVDMAVLPDGRIIAYGSSIAAAGANLSDFAVARYSADGALDLSFAAGDAAGVPGLAVIDFDDLNSWPFSLQVMSDGRIVGGVHVHSDETGATMNNNFGAFRLTADGVLDATFGEGGKAEIDSGSGLVDIGNAIVLLPDGQMVLGGESQGSAVAHPGGWGDWLNDWTENDFSMTMLDAAGALNERFGSGGFLTTDFHGDHDGILAMALGSVVTNDSGSVLSFELYAAGLAKDPATGTFGYAVAKYASHLVSGVPE